MSKNGKLGVCNICGQHKKLTFEHVPPQSAMNASKVLVASADHYWNRGPGQGQKATGQEKKRGYGKTSICAKCNSDAGRWYVPAFASWCRQASQFRENSGGASAIYHFTDLSPLPVIKQISTMFLALHGNELAGPNKEALRRFVLNRGASHLPPAIRFWVYFVAPGPLRDTPVCATLNVVTGKCTIGAEFSFPPFGYMITLGSEPEEKHRLEEITHFTHYEESEVTPMALQLEQLPTHGPALGDYRSFADMSHTLRGPNVVLSGPEAQLTSNKRRK